MDVDTVVRERYTGAAREREEKLCCAPQYEERYLDVIPAEILDRDYGCGDPSRYVSTGETVLDLGSGSGKTCYILAQIVGPEGKILGVDINEDMLALARRHQRDVASELGYDNVTFLRGRIEDLRTDQDVVAAYLRRNPIDSLAGLGAYERFVSEQASTRPLVPDLSIDVVASNCVLNLVPDDRKPDLLSEIHRVLKRGGRAVVSDIVSDEPVPDHLKEDPDLWSGCLAGAFCETRFLEVFAAAGFYGIELLERQPKPWRTIEGIEFRSVTVRAYKGKEGPCRDRNQAAIYRGPWREVTDDDGHTLRRGVPIAVCAKTFEIFTRAPYDRELVPVEPRVPVSAEEAPLFDCTRDAVRNPRETKGVGYRATTQLAEDGCGPGCC